MVQTIIPFGDVKAQKKWSSNLAVDVLSKSYFSKKFIGKGDNNIIEQKTELESDKGEKISFDLSVQLRGGPTQGDARVKGKEENLRFYSDEVIIDQTRKSVSAGGRMTRKRTAHDMRVVAKNRLGDYWSKYMDELMFIYLSGARGINEDYIEPTVLTDIDPTSQVMTEEIFGPILPVQTFKSLDEPIAAINSREKPLALYIYSRSKANTDRIIQNTRAGGTCINHSAVHFFNNNLPFGGSNNSGIGKGHGFFGFEAFSNPRGVLKQVSPFTALDLMTAPFNAFKQKLIDISIKFF